MVRKRLDMVGQHMIGQSSAGKRTWEVGGVARIVESTSLRTCKMGLHRDFATDSILVATGVFRIVHELAGLGGPFQVALQALVLWRRLHAIRTHRAMPWHSVRRF